MPAITVFSTSHCHEDLISQRVSEELGLRLSTDSQLIDRAAKHFGAAEKHLNRAMFGRPSFLDKSTHEKERHIAFLRSTMAEIFKEGIVLHHGFASHLLPKKLTHIMRVCLVAKLDYRLSVIREEEGGSAKAALKILNQEDESRKHWSDFLFGLGPWDRRLYDIKIPMDQTTVDEAVKLICDNAANPIFDITPKVNKAVDDFMLASRVNLILVEKGHVVDVSSSDGEVTLSINHYVMRVESFKQKVSELASEIPGVKTVKVKIGPRFSQPNIYPKLDLPKKILLVDDEKEFVQTLSERLQVRNLESAIAYDGEQALSIVQNDAPEVMVLDLKMPGLDGLEVLRQVKKKHPDTEVIILTGHGSVIEENIAMELGAYAYLKKPADIDILAATMKEAYQKVHKTKKEKGQGKGDEPDREKT